MAEPSHAIGPAHVPLLDITIGKALDQAVERWADADALISRHQDIRLSWAELRGEADRVASALIALGLEKGDRVGIWAPNCAEWAIVQFATAKAGLILVTINPAYQVAEVEYALNKVGCRALVTAAAFKTSDYVGMLRELGSERLPDLRHVIVLGPDRHDDFMAWDDLLGDIDAPRLAKVAAKLAPDDAINIQFTSGTTGFPKGATLTHRNILNNGYFTALSTRLDARDRICIPVPLYHCFGMVLGNLAAVTSGATMIYPGDSFDPAAVLRAIAAERCTSLYGVPTMFIALLDHSDMAGTDTRSLRTGIMAGAPCPVPVMHAVVDRLNMREVTIGYGMTETSPLTTQTLYDDSLDRRVATVGRAHPHIEAKIVGPDGKTLPRGEQGEYCARGYAVMQGYWNDRGRTAEAIDADGWMHSGDLATMDEDGYVCVTGRIKDMIIRGGENIYPREIEEYLMTHPAISAAQVFGVNDERYGEAVCAWIIASPSAQLDTEMVLSHCRGAIAHFKIPKYVRIVDSFIMTVTGKPQKFEMRKVMEAEIAVGAALS